MQHERKWRNAETAARMAARNMFRSRQWKQIEYLPYDDLDMTATLTRYSQNVITYIVQNNKPAEAKRKVENYLNCLSCDLEPWIK